MREKKQFEIPDIEILEFSVEDVITTSNELPISPYFKIDDV